MGTNAQTDAAGVAIIDDGRTEKVGTMAHERDPRTPQVYRGPARRLRVVLADGRWRVDKETRIDRMTLLPSWDCDERQRTTATCFELVDANGDVVYRRPLPAAHDASVELFESGVPHREAADRELQYSVVVPELDGRTAVRLVDRGEELNRADDKRSTHEIDGG